MGRPKTENHKKRINISIDNDAYEALQKIRIYYNNFNLSKMVENHLKYMYKELKQKQLKLL